MDGVASRMPCLNVARSVGYGSKAFSANLTPAQIASKTGTLAVTVSGIGGRGHYGTWDQKHLQYVDRRYYRLEPGDGSRCYSP